jgi:hypothetical protein
MPFSKRAAITPRCANPRVPPPLKTRPVLYFFISKIEIVTNKYFNA